MRVPYIDLGLQHQPIKAELLAAVDRVFTHGQFILGPEVAAFEEQFAKLCGTKFAIGVGNGTDALVLVLKALGIGAGDEVITAPNSFLASASCIALVGATPVFADIGADGSIDPIAIERAITPKTKAIIPVHWGGWPADMDAIRAVADARNIPVIEDAAQAVGAQYKKKPVGSLGYAACFSLHPLKNLSACGDAGVITTNDEKLYQHVLLARNHGLKDRDHCAFWSLNSRLDTLQAAMLLVKLPHLNAWTKARRDHADMYRRALTGIVDLPPEDNNCEPVYHTFIIQTDKRDALKTYLAEHEIGTAIHYPIPVHLLEAAGGTFKAGSYPATERYASRILSLPIYPELTREQQQYVIDAIKAFFSAA